MNPVDIRESKSLSNSQLTNVVEIRMRETLFNLKNRIFNEAATSGKFNKGHSNLYRWRMRCCLFIFTCN